MINQLDLAMFFRDYMGKAITDKLLMYEYDGRSGWLSVYYRNVQDADGKEWKWSLLCAQDIEDYSTELIGAPLREEGEYALNKEALLGRITLMLADKLRSVTQDLNDYTKNV